MSEVQVEFFSTQPHRPAQLPRIALPSALRRAGLSEVVRQLLLSTTSSSSDETSNNNNSNNPDANQQHEQYPSFDFIIDGELLRTSLQKYMERHDLSSEIVVRIEYIEATPTPVDKSTIQGDDWISVVRGHHPSGLYISGSYDAAVKLWNEAGQCVLSLPGHHHAVKDICVLTKDYPSSLRLLSASNDHTVRSSRIRGFSSGTLQYTFDQEYSGVDSPIVSISSSPSEEQFVAGCWNGHISVWNMPPDSDAAEYLASRTATNRKKRKHVESPIATAIKPEATMQGHTDVVSSVRWQSPTVMYSSSWDYSVRLWNVVTGQCTNNMTCTEPISTMMISSGILEAPITGHPDGTIRVWDPRSQDSVVIKLKLLSHTGWVSSLSFCPRSNYMFCSGSYDNSVKIWDVRSLKPLYTLHSHTAKVLSVHWDHDVILSGGADNLLRVNQVQGQSHVSQATMDRDSAV